ncbi:hypothetical protein [uncultured Oscillibacter sp.]|uniref:hypothetical protein n=1 Tax=uncultured Oscillibacter sp. TaxID=876091 RepID=UPI0025DD4895|nr:hypothetical protein [uncultured Oscillibacter sp.]
MNKKDFTTVRLSQGEMHIYDLGGVRLHAYQTGDPLADEVFLVEKAGKFVAIESPCFTASVTALNEYLAGRDVAGVLVAYHGAGASFLPEVPKYATANAAEYARRGGGKALIDQFTAAFGSAFDGSIHPITHTLTEGEATIGGIRFIIHRTAEAFDVEIPEIDAVYTHMLGHDCHSIVAGPGHADAMIAQLRGYIEKGYGLILTSHYTPEDLKDAETKIGYLEELKAIAASCDGAEAFKAAVRERYPSYSGENYLEMTAGAFFG